MADQFKVNGADYTSAADALAAAVPDANGNISITAINGDLTLDNSVAATGKVTLRVASADALIAGEDVSSTITITSDFASKLDMQAGTDSENANLQGCTGENAPYRIIFDGANVTGAAGFYSWNYGYVELKNGAQYIGSGADSHVRGSVLVTGEGTLLSATFLSVYAADFGSTKPYAASMVVKDGATLFATTERTDTNTFKIGHASKAFRGGELIIEGGIVKSNTDIVVNAGGTISLSNSTVNGKVNYGQIILTEKDASKLDTTNAAAGAVTISLKSADYANCDASYKIIDVQNTTALDLSKVSITLDGAAYTLGTTFGGSYSIKQVDNDLVLYYDDPYRISSQVISTDTAFNGTEKAYYTEAKTIITIAEGATMTIGSGANVDLMGTSNDETYAYMLVGGNDYFTGYTGTGTGNLVVDGNLTTCYFNAINGTATVNGTANVMNTNAEGGSFVINGALETINLKIRANSSMTVNGLGSIKLTGSASGFTQDNTADNFLFNITDADLTGMTGDTHTLLNVTEKENTAVTADKFTVKVNGAAYTLGEQFTTASGDTYVINMGDSDTTDSDTTANDLILTFVPPPPIKVINPDSSTQNFDSLLTANGFAQDGAVVEFVTSSFTDATVVAANSSLVLDKDITFKGKTTATFGITGSGYLMFGNTTTKKAINVTVAEGSDITFGGLGTGLNFRYGEDSGKKVASTLTVDNARLATSYAISSNGLVTVKGAGVKGTYGIGEATADTLDAKYLVANLASKNNITVKDRFDNYADDVALRLTDYAYVVAVNGISIGSEDGTITSIVSVENSKIEFINSAENSSCAFRFTQAHGNKLQISGDSEVLVREFDFAKEGIITIDGADAYVRAAKITVADGASATLNVTLTTEQLAAQSLELGVNTAIFEISGSGDNLLDTTVMLDGAAYTLGDEIVDDAGNKYVINMGDANGDSVENDLVMTLTEKAPEPVVPEGPGVDGGASTEPSQKVYINPYYNENTLGYFSDVVGEELVLGKNAFTSVAAAKKALGANADIEYCTSAWNSSFSGSSQLEGIAKISNNSGSMGFNYGNFVSRYNMANGALNLNKVTADTDFENFAMVNVSGSNLSGAIENNSFAFSGTGTGNNASGTAWFAQGGMVNISGSTVGEVTGYAYATLNGSDVDVLSNNNILFANVKLENGEISSISNAVTMSNGMAQINNSFVGLLENYAYATMRNSDVVEAANVTSLQSMGGANSIGSFTSNGAYSQIVNGYGSSLTLGDVTMNGSFDSIVNYGGTLVLTGNLKGVEMLYGYGDLVASDEQIKQLGGAEKVKQTYFGDIVDLGSTADGFSGKAAELADNSEAKAVIWDAASEGGLRGWLGIGSDVDVKDSVDYVKFTAAADGTLDITSSAWSSTGDKVSINGTDLAITDGAVSFGVTAGTEYLVKIERKDNNSMSYDMTLA